MTPVEWAILLGAAGIVLIVLDLVVPSHGILTVVGVLSLAAGIGVCFRINRWLGMGVLVASLIIAPVAFHWFSYVWPKTRMARGLVLRPIGHTLYAMPPYVLDEEAVQRLAEGALGALNATLQEETP